MRNKFETKIHQQLKKAKVKFSYESVKIPYTIDGKYIPDFVLANGILIEAKGYFRPEHKRKMSAVKRAHPDLDIRILFYRMDQKNIKWATKNGFPWAVGEVPQDWLSSSV